jgi:acetylornithine deacetylase
MVGACARDWRSEVLDFIDANENSIVSSLSDLVQIPSISGSAEENSIQEMLAERLRLRGLEVDHWEIDLEETLRAEGFPGVEVEREQAFGLVGRLPGKGGGPSLMFNSHVDVVPPGNVEAWPEDEPFSGAVWDGAVHGRGSCDMKGGLVASLWAVRALAELKVPLRGDLVVACVQGEEDGGLGTFAMLARGWRADACVIPEPTSLDLVPASGGALTFRLRIPGLATHSSRRASGVSAVEKFWLIFHALRELEYRRNQETDLLMRRWDIAYPIEIGTVSAGDWSSSVPDLLIAEGRYGVALGESTALARAVLEEAISDACKEDHWLSDNPVTVEWWGGQFAPGRTDESSSILSSVNKAHSSVSDYSQQTYGAPYGSDLRLMNDLGGVPTVHYGPGEARLAHGPREQVPIEEVMTTARTLAILAMEHCLLG